MANKVNLFGHGVHDHLIRQILSGVIMVCLIVTIVASALAGAGVHTIVTRALIVYATLYIFSCIIKRYWVTLSQLKQENAQEHRRKG